VALPPPEAGSRQRQCAGVERVEQLDGCHRSEPCRGDLDRQRNAVEAPGDLGRRLVTDRRGIGAVIAGAFAKQPHGVDRAVGDIGRGRGQRPERDHRFIGQVER
jgi:hypothetical protein